jgi:hypothetical protein
VETVGTFPIEQSFANLRHDLEKPKYFTVWAFGYYGCI